MAPVLASYGCANARAGLLAASLQYVIVANNATANATQIMEEYCQSRSTNARTQLQLAPAHNPYYAPYSPDFSVVQQVTNYY